MTSTSAMSAAQCKPPTGQGSEMIQAGQQWDAVRLPAYLGDRVLAALDEDCGAVIRDPYAHRLYWLVRPGAADEWLFQDIAHVQVLGSGCWVAVPPQDCVRSPGLHWTRPIVNGHVLTRSRRLHTAVQTVIADTLGPREVTVP